MTSLACCPIGSRGGTRAWCTASAHPVSTDRRGSKSERRCRRRTTRACRVRHRVIRPRTGSTEVSAVSSAHAERGRLSRSRPRAARREVTTIHTARNGVDHHGARARATRRAARRRAAVVAVATATPGSERIRAPGTTTTRRPATWARQPRSRSAPTSPKEVSQPPRSSSRSRSTRVPANGTARASVIRSYWPWSGSPGAGRAKSRPPRVIRMLSARSRCGLASSRCLGPSSPVDGERRQASTRATRVRGSGVEPTGRNQRSDGASEAAGWAATASWTTRRTGRRGSALTTVMGTVVVSARVATRSARVSVVTAGASSVAVGSEVVSALSPLGTASSTRSALPARSAVSVLAASPPVGSPASLSCRVLRCRVLR